MNNIEDLMISNLQILFDNFCQEIQNDINSKEEERYHN
jgi:hypothetical protein